MADFSHSVADLPNMLHLRARTFAPLARSYVLPDRLTDIASDSPRAYLGSMDHDREHIPYETEGTPEMVEVGAHAILCCVGGAQGLGSEFSAPGLAVEVYRATETCRTIEEAILRPHCGALDRVEESTWRTLLWELDAWDRRYDSSDTILANLLVHLREAAKARSRQSSQP